MARGLAPTLAAMAALAALALAGCASPGGSPAGPEVPPAAPGSVTGVVVDDAIRPIAGALVELLGGAEAGAAATSTTTDGQGAFAFADVEPGVHLVRASHGLFDTQQQTVDVPADGSAGATVKFQLTRVIFATPYVQTQAFDGFLVCSVGFSVYASEECGEGAGVPCDVPVLGCERVGGQGNNYAQWDFYLDGPFAKTLVVEMTWEPSSPTLSEFQLNVGNDWTCDPTCIANFLNVTGGPSPLYTTVDFEGLQLKDRDGNDIEFTAETRFSTFVWANWGCSNFGPPQSPECAQQLNVAMNQPYQVFATAFYYLPAPEGWSFLAQDPLPF